MIEVQIESVRISLISPNQVVILKELDGERRLPVFIGKPEGDAITYKLRQVVVPRPLSHDLAMSVIEALGARVSHVTIRELRDSHFFASIYFQGEKDEIEMDVRPSDALAVAVRLKCPIFVEDEVMLAAGVVPPRDVEAAGDDLGAFDDFISSLDLDDLKPEANSISVQLQGVRLPRPITHDLIVRIIREMGASVRQVLVSEMRDDTYFARVLLVTREGREVSLDSRPSDALAVAVRCECPIYVADEVMDKHGQVPEEDAATVADEDLGAFSDFLGSLDLDDLDDEGKK